MPLPRLPALLAELDATTHAARCRRIVDLARAHRDNASLASLMDGLAAHSDYHALLTVSAAAAIADDDRLHGLAGHPSPRVARAAQARLPLDGDTAALVTRYLRAAPTDRRLLRRRLATERRTGVTDALVGADLADRERAGLLAAASEGVVTTYLPDLADLVPNLPALTARHPRPVLEHLRTQVTGALGPVRDHWWAWAGPALGLLIAHDAGAVLDLLESSGPTNVLTPPVERSLGALIRHDAHRAASLIAHPDRVPGYALPSGLRAHARLFTPADRVRVARSLRDDDRLLALFLNALPPSQRLAVFDGAVSDINVAQRIWDEGVLSALPRAGRYREARRILELPHLRGDVQQSLFYRGFLPAAEARNLLAEAGRAANASERASAYVATLLAAARDREPRNLSATFTDLQGLRNEQDPVRQEVALTLQGIPAWLLADAGIAPVRGFADAIAAARDTSQRTLSALQHTAWAVVSEALSRDDAALAQDALGIVAALTNPTGGPVIPSLLGLPHGAELTIIDSLLPRLRRAADKDDYTLLLALCHALGKRAWGVPALDTLLEGGLRAPDDGVVRRAAELWLADPQTRADRVGVAVRTDESLAVLPLVQQTLSRKRQDLLGVLWQRSSLAGRLWGRRPRFVPILTGPFTRWLPRQLREYAEALDALIATPDTPTWTVTAAIVTLGRLPGVGADAVAAYADSPNLACREAALAALAWTDRPAAALARLVTIRTTDETRVAMYAASRCVSELAPSVARPLIADILSDPAAKLTARKEAVRLLGALREPAGLDLLLTIGRDPGTHRDLRLAVARTLRGYLDDPRAWEVLEYVAGLGREGALALAETSPSMLAQRHRAAYARLLVPGAALGEPRLVTALGGWTPWLPEAMSLLCDSLATGSGSPATAAEALRAGVRHGADTQPVLQTVGDLATLSADARQPDAEEGADLPARQRLSTLLDAVTDLPHVERSVHHEMLKAIVDRLSDHVSVRAMAITVAVRAIDWRDPAPGLGRALDLIDEPLRCADLRSALEERLTDESVEATPALGKVVEALRADGSLGAGVAAVTIAAHAGERTGWIALWRDIIRALRQHPSATVAGWARDTPTAHNLTA